MTTIAASTADLPAATAPDVPSAEGLPAAATWKLPGDLGRRYASVSGDRNPIHMHPLSARLFGSYLIEASTTNFFGVKVDNTGSLPLQYFTKKVNLSVNYTNGDFGLNFRRFTTIHLRVPRLHSFLCRIRFYYDG